MREIKMLLVYKFNDGVSYSIPFSSENKGDYEGDFLTIMANGKRNNETLQLGETVRRYDELLSYEIIFLNNNN